MLIENFTWDWIYGPYVEERPEFEPHIRRLNACFESADVHIQAEPICRRSQGAGTVAPVSREIRTSSACIRQALGIPEDARTVMITMGGTPFQYEGPLSELQDVLLLLPNSGPSLRTVGNVVHIPDHSLLFHPDLVHAADVVIGKIGYSTLAEVYWAGVPFGYIPRPGFLESDALVPFIDRNMPALQIRETDFETGDWLAQLPELLSLARVSRTGHNGADQIADHLMPLL